ncbi:MAG: AraC family transcriptional regulator [Proteobacteria bacterium]|nr:AraC family transcriptional regulator [Pseudomonadota bacterium]
MYNRWSTSHIAARHRAEFWRAASQEARTPITPHIPRVESFDAVLTSRGLDSLALNHVQVLNTGHDVESTDRDLVRSEVPCVFVDLYLSGRAMVTQQGDQLVATPGEPFLIDGRGTYRLNHADPVNMLALAVPYAALGIHASAVDRLVARQLPRRASLQLLVAQMQTLNLWPHALEADESCRISDLLVGTLQALLLPDSADVSTSARMRRGFLRRRVQQIIVQQYADATLSPAAVAHQMGVSVRTLHAHLAQDGTSFGAELMDYRLQRAYAMLCGARQSMSTIMDVSARCGFSSPAHFSRRFRERYGTSPGALRRQDR